MKEYWPLKSSHNDSTALCMASLGSTFSMPAYDTSKCSLRQCIWPSYSTKSEQVKVKVV